MRGAIGGNATKIRKYEPCCRHCVFCMGAIGLRFRIPSHNSIRNWACKCGYFRVNCNQVREGSHVVYVDESIVFGSEKNLLILGFPTHKTPLDRSVSDSDVEVALCGY